MEKSILKIITKTGQIVEVESSLSIQELHDKNVKVFDPHSDATNITTSDSNSITIVPKDNIALINIIKVR